MERKSLILLIAISVLGFLLRFLFLGSNPPSLNWDEVSHGYNAYSVLKTGHDQWGNLPIFNFRAYGDYPTTLNLYLTIPFVAAFGLTELSVRLPHAILGTLTILSVYFLTLGITKKKNAGLFAAFLVAIGPWYVFTSRFVLQSNLSVFLMSTAAALFVNRDKNKFFIPGSLFLLYLSLFSYHTTRIFSPLILLSAIFIYRNELITFIKNNRIVGKIFASVIALFFVLTAIILVNPDSRARGSVLFLIDQGAVNRIVDARNSSSLPMFAKRILYNRPVYFVKKFTANYLTYFSPKFLFFQGGTQYQFSLPGFGLIYPVSLPLFYIGLFLLVIKSFKDKNMKLLLFWIILSPIPASITNEAYTVLRATTMLPVPEVIMSIAAYELISRIKGKYKIVILLLYFLSLIFCAYKYLDNYFISYPKDYSWSWQYGYKEAVKYSKENYGDYDKIIVTKKYGEPHQYFLYFMSWDPSTYQNDKNAIKFFQSGWYWVDKFDKFYFVNDWQVKDMKLESGRLVDCQKESCLLITSPNNFPDGWKKLETIKFLDGKPVFEIYENK